MQGGLFYPATIFYYLFGFATATALFQAMHLFTAGWLCVLCLRSCRLSWGASLGGAFLFAFGGVMIARLPFLNHLSTLAWAPALALFFRRPVPLAVTLALMIFAGYPTFIPGAPPPRGSWLMRRPALRAGRGRRSPRLGQGGLLAGVLAAAQLLPGLELAAFSPAFLRHRTCGGSDVGLHSSRPAPMDRTVGARHREFPSGHRLDVVCLPRNRGSCGGGVRCIRSAAAEGAHSRWVYCCRRCADSRRV